MRQGHNYYVYIVECSDGAYYTGVTNDLEGRIKQHNDGENIGSFTYTRRPVLLKYADHFQNINAAIAYEKQLKGWSRKKKEALFVNDIEKLKKLAKAYSKILPQQTKE
jgi:putative endonuclease